MNEINLKIREIFYSLQGEGARSGDPSIFIRLAHCNLNCSFCDTDWSYGYDYTLAGIYAAIKKWPCKKIIWTGGEPTLQLTREIVSFFTGLGYYQAIETNGTNMVPEGIDYIACSPKVSEFIIRSNFPNGVDELRYPISAGDTIPNVLELPKAKHYFLSPIFVGNKKENFDLDNINLQYCITQCLANPIWKLSIQQHKIWKIR
jgi:7-carboxy-7-deazaguanine synthase